MGQLRRVLELIRTQLSSLTVTQRLLISSLVVIVLMALFVVTQYAGARPMVELMPGVAPDAQVRAASYLRSSGVEFTEKNGAILVPVEMRHVVLGQLGQQGLLPADTSLMFDTVLEKQSWTMTSAQHQQIFLIAKQNELARIIANMQGIREARVIIDAPAPAGLGQAVRQATASATVFTATGQPLGQQTADAIGHLVAGAEAGLDVSRVRIIDGSTSRQMRVRSDAEAVAGAYIEHQTKIEGIYRDRLLDLLQYIDGVIVAVSAQVDVRRTTSQTTRVLPPGEGTVTAPVEESSTSLVERSASRGAEPGVRSNVGLDIAQAGAGGPTREETSTDARLETRWGETIENVVDPRGMPTKINATINIPRSYFVAIWRMTAPEDAPEAPDEATLLAVIEAETARIRDDVSPLVEAAGPDGVTPGAVTVSMIPDAPTMTPARAGGFMGDLAAGGGAGGLAVSGPVKTLALGLLAAGALGVMALSLRKASKPQELPTPEELVGVPPAIHTGSDIVGEADEADAALTGIELSEDDLRRQKVQEQVMKIVGEQPAEASNILHGWITEGR
jgi:flagellar M-ring protein FliF